MKKKQRTAIRLETHEVTIVRFRRNRKIFCEACGVPVLRLSLETVAAALGVSALEIRRLARENRLHSEIGADGELLFCGNSLAALKEK